MILTIADGEEKILTRVLDLLAGETQYIQLPSEKEFALVFPGLTIYPDQYRIFMGGEGGKPHKFGIWCPAVSGAASSMYLYEEADSGSCLERRN